MIREIVLDTETTGLDPLEGHRIIEIAAIELIDHIQTEEKFHFYLNPEREIPEASQKIHNISNEMVKDKPKFGEIYKNFLDFIKGDSLVIHNAEFDLKFLNYELNKIGIDDIQNEIVDTLKIARSKYPGSSVSLDALCKKFNIDTKERVEKGHGALVDCYLLSEVYLEILGGKQPNFNLNKGYENLESEKGGKKIKYFSRKNYLKTRLNDRLINEHLGFLNEINCKDSWGMFHKSLLDKLKSKM